MTQENLYIIIKLSNIVMTFFRYSLIIGFILILVLKVYGEEFDYVSVKKQIMEMFYGATFAMLFVIVSGVSVFHPLLIWTFVLGFMLGVLQSFQLKLFVNNNQIYAFGRHFNIILFGLSCIFLEISFLFYTSFLNFAMVPLMLSFGALLGINLFLIFKIRHI